MGNSRSPGVLETVPPDGSVVDGTLARQPGSVPGVVGVKGGGSKSYPQYSRKSQVILAMRAALPGETIPERTPGQALMLRYFRTASAEPTQSRRMFFDYTLAFYVHINEGRDPAATTPPADVSYPGGNCDRWSDITSRRSLGGRRVIDCEGFAYLGQVLLSAGGWTFDGYKFAYQADDVNNIHIAAQLHATTYSGVATICVGGERTNTGTMTDEARRVFQGVRFIVDGTIYQTQAEVWTAVRAI